MDITVSTTVTVTVWTTKHTTNRQGNVMMNVNWDMQALTAAKVVQITHVYLRLDLD